MDLGYARVSTTKQDLDRQIVALEAAGIPPERIYVDKKSGATTNRPGLQAVIEYARDGDVIVVHTLDRLGRTVRDTLNLIHDLAAPGGGVRNLADPVAGGGVLTKDHVAGLFAAERRAQAHHFLQYVLIAHRRAQHADALDLERLLQAEVGHHGGYHGISRQAPRRLERAAGGEQHSVPVDHFAAGRNEDGAVGIAVEGRAERRAMGQHGLLQAFQVERAAVEIDVRSEERRVGKECRS